MFFAPQAKENKQNDVKIIELSIPHKDIGFKAGTA
jgi:hypothetical protein